MRVQSFNLTTAESIDSIWQNSLEADFNPTLAICFTDALFNFRYLSAFLTAKNIEVIGATTCGEITDNKVYEKSCSLLLLDIDKEYFKIFIEKLDDNEEQTSQKIAHKALEKFSKPAIITYASKLGVNGDRVVKGFKDVLNKDIPIFGGLAGDNFKNEEFTVFHNSNYMNSGLVALIFDRNFVRVAGKAFSGWQPLGKTHIATKVDGNILSEIDGVPALDLFIEYFGIEKSGTVDDMPLEQIPAMYPIKVVNDLNIEYMRSPLFYDKVNKSLILGGEIQQGDKIKFCPMPDIDTVQDTVDYFRIYSRSLLDVDALLINSCAGRKVSFGPMMDKEVKDIYKLWNKPIVGLMALGEFGNNTIDNECNFHNVTLSLVTLTEI